MIHPLLAKVQESSLKSEADKPKFDIGDSVEVHQKILDGDKERTQTFSGLVIARRGYGTSETFTVRKIVDGEGVERVFPVHSPKIASVDVKKRAIVRRAKLYYLRDRVGKKAFTLKERPIHKETVGRKRTRVKERKQKQAEAKAAPAAAAAVDPNAREARKARRKTKKPAGGETT